MATRTIVTWECDLCGSEDVIDTHRVTIDGHTFEAEACHKCWDKAMKNITPLAAAGRIPELVKVSSRKEIVPFPGAAWKFTAHALKRMGERHINPLDAAAAADDPQETMPGLKDNAEIRIRGNVKCVVKLSERVIITVAKRNEDIDKVA